MPAHTKPTPVRYCQHCSAKLERKRLPNGDLEYLVHFNRRKYCGRGCMAKAFDMRPSRSDIGWSTAHFHSRKMLPEGPCSKCGKTGRTDVHHKDEDWRNNSLENLERLCRSCHNKAHYQKPMCKLCNKPVKGHGYCDKHYQRFKKWGDPMLCKVNQHTALSKSED